MKTLIFLGPSLPLSEARQILDDAIYLPPAGQADLVTAVVNHRPAAVGLIDGVFQQSLSVWHKEILHALDEGVKVYGASSMGALRAAETSEFGMIGVGEIYRQYASGELVDDDEVALAHASAEHGYQKISEPMVNIRATLAAAEHAGLIDAGERARLNAIAKELYFADRTFHAMWRAAAAEGMATSTLSALSLFVRSDYVDQKRQDALELLRTIKERPAEPSGKRFEFNRSASFETLYNRDRRVGKDGVEVAQEAIANHLALHDPGFDEVNLHALNRVLVLTFANILGVRLDEADVEQERLRFRRRRGLDDAGAVEAWLAANHMSPGELEDLMRQLAYCRRLHRWFLVARWMDRSTKPLLDELRLSGRYEEWLARAAAEERLLERGGASDHGRALRWSLAELMEEHEKWTECRVDVELDTWVEEAGFHDADNLRMELSRADGARRALLRELAGL